MKRAMTIALTCTVAVLLPASVAVAGNGLGKGKIKNLAKKECNAAKKADKAAFKAVWGKNAMRNCKRDARSEISNDAKNAAQECRALRDADPDQFQEDWGTNSPKGEKSKGAGKNAFGKCVSAKAEQADEEEEDEGVPTPTE